MKRNGDIIGMGSGLFWGLGTVLIGLVLATPFLVEMGNSASLLTTFIHDSSSFVFLLIFVFSLGKIKVLWQTLRSKSGFIIILGSLLGGPIGMGAYIQSINYLGPSLSSGLSAVYPAFGVLAGFLFLKERLNKRSMLGILLSVLAIVLLGVSSLGEIPNLPAGLLFALICIVGWGSEAVIIGYALKEDVPSEIALTIRQGVSALTYGLVVMPWIGYHRVSALFSNPRSFVLIVIAALVGTISYLLYYKAIATIGPSRAMGLNITYPAWAFIFQFLIDGTFDIKTFALVCVIFIGAILTSEDPGEFLNIFKSNR